MVEWKQYVISGSFPLQEKETIGPRYDTEEEWWSECLISDSLILLILTPKSWKNSW